MEAEIRRRPRYQIMHHPDRLSIELARASGVTLDKIAERYGVHRDAIARHWHRLPAAYRDALRADVPREELAQRAAEEGSTVLDHFKFVRNVLEQQVIAARDCHDTDALVKVSRAALRANHEIARFTRGMMEAAGQSKTMEIAA